MIAEPTLRERTKAIEELLEHELAAVTKLRYVVAGLVKFMVDKEYVSNDEIHEMLDETEKLMIEDGLVIKV